MISADSALKTLAMSLAILFGSLSAAAQSIPIKELGRFEGWRDNPLVGYGLVVGLSGSGDTRRSVVTQQALQNVYSRLGTQVSTDDITSRNAAVVLVSATLPASANIGDRIDITVSSAGDARSLAGGVLLMTPLMGPDGKPYALAQGPLITGGYSFESEANLRQRNYPTTARLEKGATIEASVQARILKENGELSFFLNDPDFTTATRIAGEISRLHGWRIAFAESADEVRIQYAGETYDLSRFVSGIENLQILPAQRARIVINERTGTVVAGGNIRISNVTISQGDIRVSVDVQNTASQPAFIGGAQQGLESLIIRNTALEVDQSSNDVVASFGNSTVADLVQGLADAGVDTRRMISILQAIKDAGAMQAEIIVN